MSRQTTLNVSLTPRLRKYVRAKVSSGQYESASEVIRESLRAFQAREQAAVSFWADVRGKLAAARRQVAEGKTIDGESAMNEILAELSAHRPSKRRKTSR